MNKLKIYFLLLLFLLLHNNALGTIRYVKAGKPTPIPPHTNKPPGVNESKKMLYVK